MFKRIINLIYFSPGIVYTFLFLRKKMCVILYGNRFGHFLMNTEFFLNDFKGNLNDVLFIILTKEIDSVELKKLYEEKLIKKIYTNYLANSIYRLKNRFYKNLIIDIRPLSEAQILPIKSKLELSIPIRKFKKPHVTITIRNGNYTMKQNKNEITTFRDTPLNTLIKTYTYLHNLGYELYVVNKTLTNISKYDFIHDASRLTLKDRWAIIKGAKFHIGTSTGADIMAFFSNIPTIEINSFFGPGINSKFFIEPYVSYMLPMKLYSNKENRFLKIYEYINFLKYIEYNYFESSIINKEAMEIFDYVYIPNSEVEILESVKELISCFKHPPKISQIIFWDKYPSPWVNIKYPEVVFHDKNVNTGLRISEIFLNQFQ